LESVGRVIALVVLGYHHPTLSMGIAKKQAPGRLQAKTSNETQDGQRKNDKIGLPKRKPNRG
jgi:hypothetical protein